MGVPRKVVPADLGANVGELPKQEVLHKDLAAAIRLQLPIRRAGSAKKAFWGLTVRKKHAGSPAPEQGLRPVLQLDLLKSP